jgi:hypothetical protein
MPVINALLRLHYINGRCGDFKSDEYGVFACVVCFVD